ncbi:MAG: bifunctional 4-hydroxy-2-oxoglutarate aldolase/2-dehydro-3-deoxy-phosphogluconate aldolase [Mycobacteriales bacterium]
MLLPASEPDPAEALRGLLEKHRWLAIVRDVETQRARESVGALIEARVPLIEVTLTTPAALEIVAESRASAAQAGVTLGVGSVLSADAARGSVGAGAQFLVTPHTEPAIVSAVQGQAGVLLGALTPTEIVLAAASGAAAVKLFPAAVGGPDYLRAVLAALRGVAVVPTGGVTASNAGAFLESGAIAVAVGAWLTQDPDLVSQRAAEMYDALSARRPEPR